MSPQTFHLRPLVPSDIPSCAHLAGCAFLTDRHTQLKASRATDPYDHGSGMVGGLRWWLSKPPGSIDAAVAVDDATGEALGWVVWGNAGLDPSTSTPTSTTADETKAPRPEDFSELEEYTSADFAWHEARLTPGGARCMYICSIAVAPEAQGRGVGGALLAIGTDKADRERAYCWVHSSEAGADMFERKGWREVARTVLDLDYWNAEGTVAPEGEGARWGPYTFKYLRREPGAV